jgi:iron complex transport system ATP-binding protein
MGGVMIDGVELDVDIEAVVVRARRPLAILSSAVAGGGFGAAAVIINLHVGKGFRCEDSDAELAAFAQRRAILKPYVGLLTAAATEKAEIATERDATLTACAVVTVGLSNPVGAGRSAAVSWSPGTINTIVVVDAAPEPGALVNLVITATEVKALALAAGGVRTDEGFPASGTSTDAVVVGATGRGPRTRFGGPLSEVGWLVARAVRSALDAGIARWIKERG